MIFVVDASVAVKWFVDEPRHDIARNLIKSGASLIAPDIVLAEIANTFQKKVALGEIEQAQARKAAETLVDCFSELIAFHNLLRAALELSFALRHPVYDCAYLACAQMVNGRLVTDDARFFKRCAANDKAARVVLLNDWRLGLSDSIEESVLRDTKELLKLDQLAQETWKGICVQLGVNPYGGNLAKQVGAWELYGDSVPRRRLMAVLKSLPRENLAALLAIAWYGRGSNPDLAQGYHHALTTTASDTSTEVPMLLCNFNISRSVCKSLKKAESQ